MLFFITALFAEAKPIIGHFSLKNTFKDTPFPLFSKGNIHLIISGIGKEAVSAAVGYLAGILSRSKSFSAAYLNVGTAGHQYLEVGTPALASKIFDRRTHEVFYPTFLNRYPLDYLPLTCVEQAEDQRFKHPINHQETLYDMESSAFFKTALKFTSSELIHCFKIVSDNHKRPFDKMNVSSMIAKNLSLIEQVALSLQKISEKRIKPSEFSHLLESSHFTETQRHQLKRALQNLHLNTSEEILNFLQRHVSSSIH